jgi:outer membrane protein TolC
MTAEILEDLAAIVDIRQRQYDRALRLRKAEVASDSDVEEAEASLRLARVEWLRATEETTKGEKCQPQQPSRQKPKS